MTRMSKPSTSDQILAIAGAVCHVIGMPLTEYADARWFLLVLMGELIWMVYLRKKE